MKNYKKGRPTQHIVSILDTDMNAIVFTGTVADFVDSNFKYCNPAGKKNAKSAMYNSMLKGTTAFGGKIRVLKNVEF